MTTSLLVGALITDITKGAHPKEMDEFIRRIEEFDAWKYTYKTHNSAKILSKPLKMFILTKQKYKTH